MNEGLGLSTRRGTKIKEGDGLGKKALKIYGNGGAEEKRETKLGFDNILFFI